jgi:hypothetical protein
MSGTDNGAPVVSDTGNGIIVGATPAQPRMASDWSTTNQQPSSYVTQQQPSLPMNGNMSSTTPQPGFTQADIDRALAAQRQEFEGRFGELSTQMSQVQEARAAEIAERDRLAAEAAEARRLREEGEMEVRDLLSKKETEWQGRLEEMDRRYAADRAVFDQERRLREVTDYRQARVEQEAEYILPELREFVGGSTPEEIDASIESIKARSQTIWDNIIAQAQPTPLRPTAMPSVPPVGPMEQLPSYEQLTPDIIANMSMDDYKRYREQLLRATNPQRRQGR